MKNGVVITTAIRPSIAKECSKRVLKYVNEPRLIVVIDNASQNPEIQNFKEEFGDDIVYMRFISDKEGGLTRCWNWGIEYCIKNGCDVVMQMNDDIYVEHTINQMFEAARKTPDNVRLYGPVSDNPGVDYTFLQNCPSMEIAESDLIVQDAPHAISNCVNGFLFSAHANTYNKMKETYGYLFNEKQYPWGGQEEDFGRRLKKINGMPAVVLSCWVHHKKFKDWEKRKFFG